MTARASLIKALTSKHALGWLAVLYIVPRLLVVCLSVSPMSDADWYYYRAAAMAAGEGYSKDGVLTAYWPPGWSMTLAAAFHVFGTSMATVKAVNLLFAAAAGWLTYDLGRRIFGSEISGRAALLLLALYPNSIGYVPLALTEVCYTTLVLLICWLLVAREGLGSRVAAGLVVGYASLVKAQSILLVAVIFLVWWMRGDKTPRRFALALAQGAVVVVVAALVLLPWGLRNERVLGAFVPISTNGGLTLLTGNNPTAHGDFTPDDELVAAVRRAGGGEVAIDREARKRAMQWIKANPGEFVRLLPMKIFRLWAPDGEAEWGYQMGYTGYDAWRQAFRGLRFINQAFYACVMAGFIWAGFILFTRRPVPGAPRLDWWLLPFGIALYPTLIAMAFSGQSRFHFPVMPFVMMTIGWWITHLSADESAAGAGGLAPAHAPRAQTDDVTGAANQRVPSDCHGPA